MKIQIARILYLEQMVIMKKLLDLLSYKYGKKSDEFLYMKKEIMNYSYQGMKKLFKKLEEEKIIEKCLKHNSIRKGFKDCECGGSSYINYTKKHK